MREIVNAVPYQGRIGILAETEPGLFARRRPK